MENKLHCSIGVIVYNEADNIGKLLDALLSQEQKYTVIDEIIVVSSACTDGTDDIVRNYEAKHSIVKLITEPERRGKSAAINTFIKEAAADILIIESGDTIPAADTVEKLILPFADKNIGMVGGRPLPENGEQDFVGYSVNLLWRLHHKMALASPKLGEMVAFRKVLEQIPVQSAVDEASIEAIIRDKGLQLRYIPDAIIHNKGPENISDFIMQRRRIAAGHIWLRDEQNYEVTSQHSGLLLKLALQEMIENPIRIPYLIGTITVECFSRILGWYDLRIKKNNPFKWDIAKSTKKLKSR